MNTPASMLENYGWDLHNAVALAGKLMNGRGSADDLENLREVLARVKRELSERFTPGTSRELRGFERADNEAVYAKLEDREDFLKRMRTIHQVLRIVQSPPEDEPDSPDATQNTKS